MKIQMCAIDAAPGRVAAVISGNGRKTPTIGICSGRSTQDYSTINIYGSNASMTEPVLLTQICQS